MGRSLVFDLDVAATGVCHTRTHTIYCYRHRHCSSCSPYQQPRSFCHSARSSTALLRLATHDGGRQRPAQETGGHHLRQGQRTSLTSLVLPLWLSLAQQHTHPALLDLSPSHPLSLLLSCTLCHPIPSHPTRPHSQIARHEIPTKLIYEDEQAVAFHDLNPQAPTHALVIPKKPLTQLSTSDDSDEQLLGHLLVVARRVAKELQLEGGYRIVINDGKDGCQSVYHLHLHVLGGRKMSSSFGI